MYLKLTERFSPKKVAIALLPNLRADQVEWDYENVYEWAYVDLPELSFTLDVTRDHGMSHVDDDVIDGLTPAEIEALPTAGPTYIFGLDRRSDTYVLGLADELNQRISDSVQSEILIFRDGLTLMRQTQNQLAEQNQDANKPRHGRAFSPPCALRYAAKAHERTGRRSR